MAAQKGKDMLLKVDVPNFRGFPHVTGNDFMLSVASHKDKNDGKSRFK